MPRRSVEESLAKSASRPARAQPPEASKERYSGQAGGAQHHYKGRKHRHPKPIPGHVKRRVGDLELSEAPFAQINAPLVWRNGAWHWRRRDGSLCPRHYSCQKNPEVQKRKHLGS